MRVRVPLELSVPRLLTQAGFRVETSPSRRISRTLFDTRDRRLAVAGGELSLNRREGWRWTRQTLGHPKLTSRVWTAPPEALQAQVVEWARAYHRGRAVSERVAVTVHSRRHEVRTNRAEALLTLVEERLDEQGTSAATPRLRHVEVIDAPAGATALIAAVRGAAIADAPTLALLRPAPTRARRLRLPGDGRTDARDLFTRSTTLSLIQWLYFDCELSSGSPDALRKLRVALRRLRSDLQTFAPLLDRAWADQLREELGRLGSRLGDVRDGEVLVERLSGLVEVLPDGDRTAALPLLDTASTQVAAARGDLLSELERQQYLQLLEDVFAAVTAPRWKSHADLPVARLARRPWRRLRSYVESLDKPPEDAQLHRVRILAKRARYAADACIPAVGAAAAELAAQLAALQTVLGEHHDAVVTREWLHRQADATTGVSFIAGELAALELRNVADAAARWHEQWVHASRPGLWRWLRS